MTRPHTYSHSFPSCTPRIPQRPTCPSAILQYRAHAVHMILFVPSTSFHSSATLPIARPGGSRTSRTSFSVIIVIGTLPVPGQNTLGIGYRIAEERKCSQPFPRRGSLPVFVIRTFPPEAATFPIRVRRCPRGAVVGQRSKRALVASARTVARTAECPPEYSASSFATPGADCSRRRYSGGASHPIWRDGPVTDCDSA